MKPRLDVRTRPPTADDPGEVLRWRFLALRRCGFAPETAAELAARTEIDLHRALELVRAGCPPELAAEILL